MGALERALAKLDDDDRALLDGRYFRPVPLATLAERQQTSTRAIEGRLARLRTRLKKSIRSELQQTESSS